MIIIESNSQREREIAVLGMRGDSIVIGLFLATVKVAMGSAVPLYT